MTAAFSVQSLWTPDRVHLRAGVWRPDGRPRAICVLLNGHAEFLEKYGEVADELTRRGFAVASLDWRGQGASERQNAPNRAAHVANFSAYDSDLGALLLQAVVPLNREYSADGPALPVFALAHSMGAHILLRHLHDHPRRFAAAIMIAPMLAIDTGSYSELAARMVALLLNAAGPSARFVFGVEHRDPLELAFEKNVQTSDRARFGRTQKLLASQPYLRINGPTFGWLKAAFASMALLKRKRYAGAIATPSLIFGAGRDRIVKTAPIAAFAARMPNAKYVEIADSEHEILMEKDSIRDRFWNETDAFLARILPRV